MPDPKRRVEPQEAIGTMAVILLSEEIMSE